MINNKKLNTDVLPDYNCNNCKHFKVKPRLLNTEVLPGEYEPYAYECANVVHPLQDCVLRGFETHSEQPGFTQTLNK